jgi:hypothetical protein
MRINLTGFNSALKQMASFTERNQSLPSGGLENATSADMGINAIIGHARAALQKQHQRVGLVVNKVSDAKKEIILNSMVCCEKAYLSFFG